MPIIKEQETRVFTISLTISTLLDAGEYTQERVDAWADSVNTFTHLFAIKGLEDFQKSEEFDNNFLDSKEFKSYTTYKYAKKTFESLGPLASIMEDISMVLSSDIVDITEFADLTKIKDYE